MVQTWNCDKNFNVIASKPLPLVKPAVLLNKYTLTFDYACRKNVAFNSCQGKVFWNGKEVTSIVPSDYLVHSEKVSLEAMVGENALKFETAGKSDGYGLTIDNVKLVKDGSSEDVVINGGFEQPDLGKKWRIQNEIPGWKGKDIEVGWGKIYSKEWNSQIVELDGHRNQPAFMVQTWNCDKNFNVIQAEIAPPLIEVP